MSIYRDFISESLSIRNIFEIYPELSPEELYTLPEDAILAIPSGELHPKYGLEVTEETRKLMAQRRLGKKHSEETLSKMRKPRSEEGKRNIAIGVKRFMDEVGMSQETIEKIRASCTGQKRTDESREKMKKNALIKKPCPYCGMMGNPGTLARHIKARHDIDK